MTVEEIKKELNERCVESWIVLKAIENVYGKSSTQAEKALTKWVTYDNLFRDLFNERPCYEEKYYENL